MVCLSKRGKNTINVLVILIIIAFISLIISIIWVSFNYKEIEFFNQELKNTNLDSMKGFVIAYADGSDTVVNISSKDYIEGGVKIRFVFENESGSRYIFEQNLIEGKIYSIKVPQENVSNISVVSIITINSDGDQTLSGKHTVSYISSDSDEHLEITLNVSNGIYKIDSATRLHRYSVLSLPKTLPAGGKEKDYFKLIITGVNGMILDNYYLHKKEYLSSDSFDFSGSVEEKDYIKKIIIADKDFNNIILRDENIDIPLQFNGIIEDKWNSCKKLNEKGIYSQDYCCPDLISRNYAEDTFICTSCGDMVCSLGENYYNCDLDCKKTIIPYVTEDKMPGDETTYIKINSCIDITKPGNYVLTKNLVSSGDCIRIFSDNVNIDGNGYTLSYVAPATSGGSVGIVSGWLSLMGDYFNKISGRVVYGGSGSGSGSRIVYASGSGSGSRTVSGSGSGSSGSGSGSGSRTVSGSGSGSSGSGSGGILNENKGISAIGTSVKKYANISIKNVSVINFGYGIYLFYADNVIMDKIIVRGNRIGLFMSNVINSKLLNSISNYNKNNGIHIINGNLIEISSVRSCNNVLDLYCVRATSLSGVGNDFNKVSCLSGTWPKKDVDYSSC